jgi:signal transduction histidine kinase
MISCFLYETSRQKLHGADLVNYIRAQLPLDDDSIKIDIKISDELPYIYVNKIRVARAIINILENAIIVPHKNLFKHIIFEVKPVDNGIHIIVQDNGIGIEESDLPLVWEVGYSKNNTSGIGLPFAKQIIEANEGTINIISEPNEGTIVTVFLPSIDITSDSSS